MNRPELAVALAAIVVVGSACAGRGAPPIAATQIAATPVAVPSAGDPGGAARTEPAIVGTTWHWFRTLDPERSREATDPTRYTLTLSADGRALVRADCNRGGGAYTLRDGRLELGPIGTTKMACASSDGLEGAFLRDLAAIRVVALSAGMLRADLYADSGTMFFVAEPEAKFGSYRCADGRRAWAVYTQDRARVVAGPDTWDLPLAVSASGARYAAGDVVWWTKGDGAFLERAGTRMLSDCTR